MSHVLKVEDFPKFFEEVHGYLPFPWQMRLARHVAETNRWPEVLDLPTGSGKTAALDVAVFHLALQSGLGAERRAAVRIALIVDRRLVVDDAFGRAKKIAEALASAEPESVAAVIAQHLRLLAGENSPPLLARRLRGGIPHEDDWARTPSQPTVLCSTVDQVGSRLLFRGYGVSNSMKPVHAGLIGADCLILLDEAHLSEPFRQTLGWVKRYQGDSWRENRGATASWDVTLLTATPGAGENERFQLENEDYANETLGRRWRASKPALLVYVSRPKGTTESVTSEEEERPGEVEEIQRVAVLVSKLEQGLQVLKHSGLDHPALAVVVNRVARARAVFEELRNKLDAEAVDLILMIGPARPVDRDALANRLDPVRTGQERTLEKPLVIVATQCIEAGVDIDLDGLISDAAPIDALRHRFGRVNRDGRNLTPYSAIIGSKADAKDPVYGEATGNAWKYLTDNPDEPARKGKDSVVDFGLAAFRAHTDKHPLQGKMLSPKPDAPVLLPAHLDLLSQTSPVPSADPEVALYLHGSNRASDSISIVWRADVEPRFQDTFRLLRVAPPRTGEAIELPVWVVRQWLLLQSKGADTLADVPVPYEDKSDAVGHEDRSRRVFRWTGDQDGSRWISPREIRPGDTLVVPAAYGGLDLYGWKPGFTGDVRDVALLAAEPFCGRHFAVRVAPALLEDSEKGDRLAQSVAKSNTRNWKELRAAVLAVGLPAELVAALSRLDMARSRVEVHVDIYGENEEGCPLGVLFVAPTGLADCSGDDALRAATEDDAAGSLCGCSLSLQQHTSHVEETAERFARLAGVANERVLDLKLAGYLHDAGKADPRFQAWLAYGDPLGFEPTNAGEVLAKSSRPLPRQARTSSGLPDNWRHEALSVRLAPNLPRFAEAQDPELVLWLVGTHHGYGRPFFPHADHEDRQMRLNLPGVLGIPQTLAPGPGPQSLAYDWNGLDWAGLYEQLRARYGVWELARMEAILRLADHRASESAEQAARGAKQ